MRASPTVLLMVLAVGCGPRFRIAQNELTCSESYLTWAGGLTNHVLQGNGNGQFSYAPASQDVQHIDGYYDLETGDFWWTERYADGAWRVEDRALGYGTLWRDGDLDLEYDLTVELAGDRSEDLVVRDKRFGCEIDRRVEDEDGNVEVFEGTITGGQIEYTRAFADTTREYLTNGVRAPDGSWTEDLDLEDGDFQYRVEDQGDLELSWRRDFLRVNAYTTLEGWVEQQADGTLVAEYTFEPANGPTEDWTYTLDALGNGEGSLDYGSRHCDLSFSEGDAEADGCNRNGDIEPPLTTDQVLVRL